MARPVADDAAQGGRRRASRRRCRTSPAAGAVNTLVRRDDGGWDATNTDVVGVVRALRRTSASTAPSALVVGGRGHRALRRRWPSPSSASRPRRPCGPGTPRAADLLGRGRSRHGIRSGSVAGIGPGSRPGDDVVVSTVPAAAEDARRHRARRAPGVLLDVVYAGWPTPLARAAGAAGMTVVPGLDMLVHQAAEQFRLFTGHEAPVDGDGARPVGAAPGASGDPPWWCRGRRGARHGRSSGTSPGCGSRPAATASTRTRPTTRPGPPLVAGRRSRLLWRCWRRGPSAACRRLGRAPGLPALRLAHRGADLDRPRRAPAAGGAARRADRRGGSCCSPSRRRDRRPAAAAAGRAHRRRGHGWHLPACSAFLPGGGVGGGDVRLGGLVHRRRSSGGWAGPTAVGLWPASSSVGSAPWPCSSSARGAACSSLIAYGPAMCLGAWRRARAFTDVPDPDLARGGLTRAWKDRRHAALVDRRGVARARARRDDRRACPPASRSPRPTSPRRWPAAGSATAAAPG